jgi:hypothetical protein
MGTDDFDPATGYLALSPAEFEFRARRQ